MPKTRPCQSSRKTTREAFRILNSLTIPAVKAGIANPLPFGLGVIVLETTGHKSGKRRQIPLVAARIGDCITVSTARPSSQWVKNLKANPTVSVWLWGEKRKAVASTDEGVLTTATLKLT